MDDVIECVRAPARGSLVGAKGLFAARQQTRRAAHRPIGGSIARGITGEHRAGPAPIRQGGHAPQRCQTIRLQRPFRCQSWSHWEGREYRVRGVGDGHTLFSLLMGGADVPQGDDTSRIDAARIGCTTLIIP